VQAIKALRVGPLHSYLVRERQKTIAELYEEFSKFSKSEVLHFRNLEQQRKAPKHNEASRTAYYNDNQRNYPKQVCNIDSDDCGPTENWENNFDHLRKEEVSEPLSRGETSIIREGACQAEAAVIAEAHTRSSLYTTCIMAVRLITIQKIAPYS
jgi:hypothetical protein